MRKCSVDGCENKHYGRGYCNKHLKRFNKYDDPLLGGRMIHHCEISGCDDIVHAKGWCSMHYQRHLKWSDPLKSLNDEARHCNVTDCENKHSGKGYCKRHYDALKRGDDPHNYTRRGSQYNKRVVIIRDGVGVITLSDGREAFISPEDVDLVRNFNWCPIVSKVSTRRLVYAATNVRCEGAGEKTKYASLYLHRHLMSQGRTLTRKDQVDHIDGDGLNCRRNNMRIVTHSINLLNHHQLDSRNTSGYNGIHWSKRWKRWLAVVRVTGKGKNRRWCRHYVDKIEAAEARDLAVLSIHGDGILSQSLNFPEKYEEYQASIISKRDLWDNYES